MEPEQYIMNSFIVMFIAVITLSLTIVAAQWLKNKHSPRIVTQATVWEKHIEQHYIRKR